MNPVRSLILAAAGSDPIRRFASSAPGARGVVDRFVAGESCASVVSVVRELAADGRYATIDYLGEDTTDVELADLTTRTYLNLLDQLYAEGLADRAEVSVKLSAVGSRLGERVAVDNAYRICAAAEQCGTTVTLDMEDHTATESTLAAVHELRRTWPSVGAVLQSYLRRTETDAAQLIGPQSRVRLCKGAYDEPDTVAYPTRQEVDLSYVRVANQLLAGDGYPMFATHDPRLVEILAERARWYGRKPGSYEFQLLYGVRPDEQSRLAAEGETVRVYLPFGQQWYGYLLRRLAERPANLTFFLRALASRS